MLGAINWREMSPSRVAVPCTLSSRVDFMVGLWGMGEIVNRPDLDGRLPLQNEEIFFYVRHYSHSAVLVCYVH